MIKKPNIFRKRFIPNEIVNISSDELIYRSDRLIVTTWVPIRPREDFSSGISYTFLKEGFKISKFFSANKELLYWYCDIIEVEYNIEEDTYIFSDMLLDVKLTANNELFVLDADEFAICMENDVIDKKQACNALKVLNYLLNMIYKKEFPPKECLENYELLGSTKI